MKRTDIINYLTRKNNYVSYLEIGVRDGLNFFKVDCLEKIGVDPDTSKVNDSRILQMTSDDFFSKIKEDRNFDIIFIDGLHLEHQVDKDVENSIKHLSERGTIVLHDCSPPTKYHAREDINEVTPAGGKWNGTVWKSFVKFRYKNSSYESYVVDTDWGCGVIQKANKNSLYRNIESFSLEDCLQWDVFDKNRSYFLNLVSTNEFLEKTK